MKIFEFPFSIKINNLINKYKGNDTNYNYFRVIIKIY